MASHGCTKDKEQDYAVTQAWEKFLETHDDSFRNQLIKHYIPLVTSAAQYLHSKLPNKVERDDLISAGNFGLMDAINKYGKIL